MDIASKTGEGSNPVGEVFAFDREQALSAAQHIGGLASTVGGLAQTSEAQEGAPSLGGDRVSKAIADILTAQNEVISGGAARLSGKLEAVGQKIHASAEAVHQSDKVNDHSLTAHPTTGS
jgi:hypothetical protein